MSYFPTNEDEISLIKFIAKYQYLNVSDAKYFFNSSRYYRNRIKNLIDKNFLRKIRWMLVLGGSGIQYVKALNFEYNKLNKNQEYRERLLHLSNIAAYYNDCKTVNFIPSFAIKDKRVFTTTGRRFIGIFDINGFEYLTYKIFKEHDNKYIQSVIYDIQKEMKYKNIIILIDDINRIDLNNFAFGLNQIGHSYVEIKSSDTNWIAIIEKDIKEKLSFCDKQCKINYIFEKFYIVIILSLLMSAISAVFFGKFISKIANMNSEHGILVAYLGYLLFSLIYIQLFRSLEKAFPKIEISILDKNNNSKKKRNNIILIITSLILPIILNLIYDFIKLVIK